MPDPYPLAEVPIEGHVSLTWHVQAQGRPLLGWMMCVTLHGTEETWVTTVTRATITSDAKGLVVADCTMFASEDGKPIWGLSPAPVIEDGEIKQGTFRFYVTSLRTCVHEGAITVRDGKCDLEAVDA